MLLSASLADAGFLAVSNRLDGHRPDQRDLSGALPALSAHRGLADTESRHVWGVFGDGEMDEPEVDRRPLTLAAREKLDNLTFIINCNLQRLDGPVRGNGQIIQELESAVPRRGLERRSRCCGARNGTRCSRATPDHALLAPLRGDRRRQIPDARRQGRRLQPRSTSSTRTRNCRRSSRTCRIAEIDALKRGGHDFRKLYAAFAAARAHKGRPTVILAKTKKGFGMGGAGESRMTAHQAKKLDVDALLAFRDRFALPLTDEDVAALKFYKPAEDSAELTICARAARRSAATLPKRRARRAGRAGAGLGKLCAIRAAADGKEMSTTMAAVRMLGNLLKDKTLGPRIVPIVADEARTFGMANLFRQIGIYSPVGQLYEPEDAGSMLYYRESQERPVAGGRHHRGRRHLLLGRRRRRPTASTACAMLPVYIYYSMFGFQRVGDLIWAAADQRARGFLFGATAGRTTLGGRGPATSGRFQPCGRRDHAELPRLRPGFRLRTGGHHRSRRAPMMEAARRRVLLRHGDERKLRSAFAHAGWEADIIKGMYNFGTRGKADAEKKGQTARFRCDISRSHRGS